MARPAREHAWLQLREGVWYLHWYDRVARRARRKSLQTTDDLVASAALTTFNLEFRQAPPLPRADNANWRTWAVKMCRRARENAKQKGRVYSINPEFVEALMSRQGYRCAVTNMRFSRDQSYRNPFAPSLDQVKPGAGYTEDNVRVVTVIANTAMNGWGEGPLRRMIVESRLLDSAERLVERTGIEPVLPT